MRGLHGNVIADAVTRIEIEARRGLKAPAQGDEQALRNIALRKADRLRAGAVYIDGEIGKVERLLNARVRRAR